MSSAATIRPATVADAAGIAALYATYVTDSVASFEEDAPDAAEIARRMLAPPRLPWLIATREGVTVGYCYGARHRARPAYRWSVECSVYLREVEQGRGTARALYGELLQMLADLGYVTALAGVTLPNEASVRFHETMDFRSVGVFEHSGFKRGAWHDVGWWQRPLGELPENPPPPRPWEPPPS